MYGYFVAPGLPANSYRLTTQLGIAITCLQAAILTFAFLRHRRRGLPLYGWPGLFALLFAEALLFAGIRPVAIYFTPIAWTCYIVLVDAAVLAIRGHSRLRDHPRQFAIMALLSIPLWLIFEAYNLRLRNWIYAGVPQAWPLAILGYGWSFATITPGILETADLIESFGWFAAASPLTFSRLFRAVMVAFGAVCLLLPLVLPQSVGARLFAFVWIGFIFLLDPINFRLGLPSLLGDFEQGQHSRFYSLMVSGFICGWFWEFWNYWAAAKWYYIFPMFSASRFSRCPYPDIWVSCHSHWNAS